jgi:2-desacetyl-2-hydroxyethyl bacteriochlorophyllide A dehydrogenase
MKYRAAVFKKIRTIEIEYKNLRSPDAGEVLIRNRACGVCGTDLHLYQGAPGSTGTKPPVVLGHEFAGEVVETGSQVRDLQPGDLVTIDPNIACGRCTYCRMGEPNLCSSLAAIGVNYDGGFAEYCVVPRSQVYVFDTNVPYHHAAMSEPVACCLHGIDRIGFKEGQTVAVVGSGAIGLIMVQLAFLSGASRVFASDPIQRRREIAEQLGAITADPARLDLCSAVRDTLPEGVDAAIECAGNPTAMNAAIKSVRRGGTALLFSVPSVKTVVNLQPYQIFHRELRILGSFTNPYTQGRAVDLIGSGKIQLEPLITHRLPLESIQEAFQIFGNPDAVKIVIEMSGGQHDSVERR